MKGTIVAKRYAGALLDLASELKKVDEIASDMRLIHSSISDSRDLRLFFESPVIDHAKKNKVVRTLFEKKIDEVTLNFLLLLVEKGRESLVEGIAVEFTVLLDELFGIVNAQLKAPYEFDEKDRAMAHSKLEELTNKKVRVSFSLDKSLVGGFLAQIGDTVYDGSVRRQLEILKKQLSENSLLQN
ncbi:MAG: ATP synthase F1 subunit delta [Bacteroidetes bacterium]|nr:ATP synthase F1 subunit delta [Bacteroidota bacterium]